MLGGMGPERDTPDPGSDVTAARRRRSGPASERPTTLAAAARRPRRSGRTPGPPRRHRPAPARPVRLGWSSVQVVLTIALSGPDLPAVELHDLHLCVACGVEVVA